MFAFGSPDDLPEGHPMRAYMEEQRSAHERHHMAMEDLGNRFRALVYEELTYEQLEVIHHVLGWIADAHDVPGTANYYHGMVAASLGMRSRHLGQGPQPQLTDIVDLDDGSE